MISASFHPSFTAYPWSSRDWIPPTELCYPLSGRLLCVLWSRNLWPYLEPVHYIHNYSQGCSLVVITIRPSSCSVHTLWITQSNVFFHALFRDGVHGKYTYVCINSINTCCTYKSHIVTWIKGYIKATNSDKQVSKRLDKIDLQSAYSV